ncbi:MAG TPA: MauE/DoxX family redox-associated membrane protein [Flavobacteriales bacterium]|nr:MauE/DoxX family redox-associated membrane protein [Flavobacteriales bacterium]
MGSKIFTGLIVFSRIFVGAVFIVSGMVKANDTLGFSYKLEEYFSEAAFGWTFFEPYSLLMAALVSCGEMILGFAILFGGKPKLTVWLLLLLTVFFGFLTYYTATCDPNATYTVVEAGKEVQRPVQCVTDCGCFGDALKGTIGRSLTPWESFYKDMVLLFFVLILFIGMYAKKHSIRLNDRKDDVIILGGATVVLVLLAGYFFQWWFPVVFALACFAVYLVLKRNFIPKLGTDWTVAIAISLASFGFAWYTYNYLPVKDFTPYAVGKNIPEQMKSAQELGLEPPVYAFMYHIKNKKTGEERAVRSDEWLANKELQVDPWEFKSADPNQIKVKDGYIPPIPALSLYLETDSGSVDIAPFIINNPKQIVLLMVMTNLENTKTGKIEEMKTLQKEAFKKRYLFYVATSAGPVECMAFNKKHKSQFVFVNGDEQGILKPMVRSNPGLLVLHKGVILGKWHYNTLPDMNEINELVKE